MSNYGYAGKIRECGCMVACVVDSDENKEATVDAVGILNGMVTGFDGNFAGGAEKEGPSK